ncbi:PAS domain S-box protein [Halovulum dunhuangense]|uniref:histidine kinase n=1 Tax=Halovulum dunhuangense TaxID=1505036 RepID=A0A849L4N4_9RHOB|nr:ATP-binding protein [Halovulum dunhuangense]NNU81152.1 PAS domain S-box protein [Halovulum dunhuangense]
MTGATLDAAVLNAVFDSAAEAMVVTDRYGRMLRVNAATLRMFGHKTEEILGASLSLLIPRGRSRRAVHDMQSYPAETILGAAGTEVEARRKDGSRFSAGLSVGRVTCEDGPLFVVILHDLTQRKAVERALERARRMESVGRLSGTLAHDFKNMLTVIIGNLELLERRIPPGAENELIQDALDAAQTGVDLTDSLMGFSRHRNLAPRRLDINAIVERGSALMRRSLGPDIDVTLQLAGELWPVKADASQLRSALINLVLNAQEAMPEGGRLMIRTENTEIDDAFLAQELDIQPGSYVRISVCDTGIGMDEETQLRAFEPLFTTKQKTGGMGLGLASVYGFALHSGGHATIYSEPGVGTTVSLYLPADEAAEQNRIAPQPAAGMGAGDGQVVLVVEDRPELRRSTLARLEALGYATLGAADTEEALALLGARPDIALVLTDLVIGEEPRGLALTERIRERFPHVRTLLATGCTQELHNPLRAGDADLQILHKPYRQIELAARLDHLLGRASA